MNVIRCWDCDVTNPRDEVSDLGAFKSAAQAVKVASILVHVAEAMSNKGHELDAQAVKGLITDPEVKAWLGTFPEVLLPVKR